MTTKGFLLFAFNNDQINYGKLSVCCGLSIKTNLKHNNITLVTDKRTYKSIEFNYKKEVIDKVFDNVIISNKDFSAGERVHYDTPWTTFIATFKNKERTLSYQHSPYDETIIIDVDYLITNDDLDYVWGTSEDMLMNHKADDLQCEVFGSIKEQRLGKYGIPMYWATLVYFKKCDFAETFFNLVDYIRENYDFYQFLYDFDRIYYRNDFAFSIATHILNNYVPYGIKSFPQDTIMTAHQKDSLVKIKSTDEFLFLSHCPDEEWLSILINTKGFNIHMMNKRNLLNVSGTLIKMYLEKLK